MFLYLLKFDNPSQNIGISQSMGEPMYVEDRVLFSEVIGTFRIALSAGASADAAAAAAVNCFSSLMPQEAPDQIRREVAQLIATEYRH